MGRDIVQIVLRTLSLVETLGYNRANFMAITVGTQLGSYEITELLGRGGMGVVYRALYSRLNRPVGIKLLSEDLGDAAARRRFQREARWPAIFVSEFVDGGT